LRGEEDIEQGDPPGRGGGGALPLFNDGLEA